MRVLAEDLERLKTHLSQSIAIAQACSSIVVRNMSSSIMQYTVVGRLGRAQRSICIWVSGVRHGQSPIAGDLSMQYAACSISPTADRRSPDWPLVDGPARDV